jgi:hypothetical protein
VLESIPPSEERKQALKLVQRLDCNNPDPTLTPCDPSRPPPAAAAAWQRTIEENQVVDAAYATALGAALKTLVCQGQDNGMFSFKGGRSMRLLDNASINNAVFVLRGLASRNMSFKSRLEAVGPGAPMLIDYIMSNNCLVSALLTDADKARLLQIKQNAINAGQ